MDRELDAIDDRVIGLEGACSQQAEDSEAWAVGERGGTPVTSGDETFENNSKYYANQASNSATNAGTSETNAGNSATSAGNSANTATQKALDAEAWADGTRNGTPVTSGDPAYQNNAKYYKEQAQQIAGASIGGLSDVTITTPTEGQVLTYDATNNIWINSNGGIAQTASGNPISITTDSAQVARSITITLNPIQAGSGDPSPQNVRPISGYSSIELTVNSDQQFSHSLPSTIYGGSLNVDTGVLTVDRGIVDLGTLTWVLGRPWGTDGTAGAALIFDRSEAACAKAVCSIYHTAQTETEAHRIFGGSLVGICVRSDADEINIYDSRFAGKTANEIQTALSGVQLSYIIRSPYTIQLTPQQVALIAGANTITSNGTTIELTYRTGKMANLEDTERQSDTINKVADIANGDKSASKITAGTLKGQVNANTTAQANLGTAQVRDIYFSDTEVVIGSASSDPEGSLRITYR